MIIQKLVEYSSGMQLEFWLQKSSEYNYEIEAKGIAYRGYNNHKELLKGLAKWYNQNITLRGYTYKVINCTKFKMPKKNSELSSGELKEFMNTLQLQ